MWLILDIGNSRIKAGVFDGETLQQTFHLASDSTASMAAYRHSLRTHLRGLSLERIGIASVVPTLTERVQNALRAETLILPECIQPNWPLPFAMGYEHPEKLGADRLAGAVAGWHHYGRETNTPVIVVDAGTAVNYEVISDGTYRGGAIGPGLQTMIRALSRGTAQLPEIRPVWPQHPIGRNTQDALQSGLVVAFVEGVAGVIRHLSEALDVAPLVIATGGDADLLAQNLSRFHAVEPHLVLRGTQWLLANHPQ